MSAPARRLAHRLIREAGQPGLPTESLSPELEAAAARRLGALALLTAVAVTVLMVIGQLTRWMHGGAPRVSVAATVLSIVLSLTLYTVIASGRVPARLALRLGLVYQVVQGFLSSVGYYGFALVPGVAIRGWSSAAVWMVVFPLIVPARFGRTVAATLATAAADPLGLWVNIASGVPRPPGGELVRMFVPTMLACVIAPLGARIVYRLTVEVKQAREMGSYQLVEKLGQGGMGEVWRARHQMLARDAAIKLIRPAMLAGGEAIRGHEMVRRFEREAQATATLRSPHTIAVYDYGVGEDGAFHYVMELLDGFSLQTLVDRFGPVPPERAVHLLRQACHSLAEAHDAGLVHRDVKPANMFVCRLGLDLDFVKVLDFGLVKLQGPQARGAEALTVEGAFAGTPAFMPPEMALGVEAIDGRADIYALGCVAYWLLTGRRVFENPNAMQVVLDHIRTLPVPPSQRASQAIPEKLERLVLRCLEKEPGARPASVAELSAELETLKIEELWTEERVRQWWGEHGAAGGTVDLEKPTVLLEASSAETRSQVAR
jgi:serine/threonine-protein kinase